MYPPAHRITRRTLLGIAAAAVSCDLAGCTAAAKPRFGHPEAAKAAQTPSLTVPGSPPAADGASPDFSDVSQITPDEVVQYFAGRDPDHPGAGPANFLGYSPADILESMDTSVLDGVAADHGPDAIHMLEQIVATNLLEALLAVYGSRPVMLALDAGHGGNPSVFYDPGSNGTEAVHTREVVAIVEELARDPRYATITIRRIFNDAIGDDFQLPAPEDNKTRAQMIVRNGRASMLAYEVDAWNRAHPRQPVAMHLVSVHFNANSGGTLLLHEGDDVPAAFQDRSVAYAQWYVEHARPQLNASGLLPSALTLVQGTGLHDDSLMYAPPLRATGARVNPLTGSAIHGPPRYAMLEASLFEQDFLVGLLKYRGLA